MTFSEKLLLIRKQKELSQEQLAKILDVSRQSISKWETQQTLPEPNKLVLISNILDVSIDQLLKDDLSISEENETTSETEITETTSGAVKLDIMFCTKCGKENRADSAFCGYYGKPFTAFIADRPETGGLTKTDMDLAYYKANLQMQQQALHIQQQELEKIQH